MMSYMNNRGSQSVTRSLPLIAACMETTILCTSMLSCLLLVGLEWFLYLEKDQSGNISSTCCVASFSHILLQAVRPSFSSDEAAVVPLASGGPAIACC